MEDWERESVKKAIILIDSVVNTLQYQVLNNIDVHVEGSGSSKDVCDRFVKRPIMNSVTRLKAKKLDLLKLVGRERNQEAADVSSETKTGEEKP